MIEKMESHRKPWFFFRKKQGAKDCLQSMSLADFHLIKKNPADHEGTQSSHIKRAIPR